MRKKLIQKRYLKVKEDLMGSIVEIEGYKGKQLNEGVQQNSMKQK